MIVYNGNYFCVNGDWVLTPEEDGRTDVERAIFKRAYAGLMAHRDRRSPTDVGVAAAGD